MGLIANILWYESAKRDFNIMPGAVFSNENIIDNVIIFFGRFVGAIQDYLFDKSYR